MKLLLAIILFSFKANAFTLVHPAAPKFGSNEITVNVSSDSCSGAGLTTNSLLDMVEEVSDEYWNSVSTSAIELKRGGIVSAAVGNVTTLDAAAALAEQGTILVGCNTNTTLFPSPGSDSIGGLGGIAVSNGVARGAILINANGNFSSLSDSQQRAIVAHEIGHAIGLGHSSDEVALMYFSVGGKIQEKLSIDDKDGVTYLYPHDDFAGSCGTIEYVDGGGKGPFITTLFILFMALYGFGKWRRAKATSFY